MKTVCSEILVMVAVLALGSACGEGSDTPAGSARKADPSFSGNTQLTKATCVTQVDRQNDGKFDLTVTEKFDDTGRLTLITFDDDANGITDTNINFSYSGEQVTIDLDTNGDGQTDSTSTQSIYTEDSEDDSNASSSTPEGVTTRQEGNTTITEVDLDTNGTVDLRSTHTCTGPNLS
jgi:hypothetical protein